MNEVKMIHTCSCFILYHVPPYVVDSWVGIRLMSSLRVMPKASIMVLNIVIRATRGSYRVETLKAENTV